MGRASLGQGQPFFVPSDISHAEKLEDERNNNFRIMGYSKEQQDNICLFIAKDREDLHDAMKKLGKILKAEYH